MSGPQGSFSFRGEGGGGCQLGGGCPEAGQLLRVSCAGWP